MNILALTNSGAKDTIATTRISVTEGSGRSIRIVVRI